MASEDFVADISAAANTAHPQPWFLPTGFLPPEFPTRTPEKDTAALARVEKAINAARNVKARHAEKAKEIEASEQLKLPPSLTTDVTKNNNDVNADDLDEDLADADNEIVIDANGNIDSVLSVPEGANITGADGGLDTTMKDSESANLAEAGYDMDTTMRDAENSYSHTDLFLPLSPSALDDGSKGQPTPKELKKIGATKGNKSGVGFPTDTSLVVEDFESRTKIDRDDEAVKQLAEDLENIKNLPATEIPDAQLICPAEDVNSRVIESFTLHGNTVARIKFKDVDIKHRTKKKGEWVEDHTNYKKVLAGQFLEEEVNKGFRAHPPVKVEQFLAAYMLLCLGGNIPTRCKGGYFKDCRNVAQQQLWLNKDLEELVKKEMKKTHDPNFEKMLALVKRGIVSRIPNPYHQVDRDEYAMNNGLFHYVQKMDIIMVLDGFNNVIVFQFSPAFSRLLPPGVMQDVAKAIDTFSTLHPVARPDNTRHPTHFATHLKERPEFDYRIEPKDYRCAKSGLYHMGLHDAVGHPHQGPFENVDSSTPERGGRLSAGHCEQQFEKLRYSAFGACTELAHFFFNKIDPELLTKYLHVAKEAVKDYPHISTRKEGEVYLLRALLINLMTDEHRDASDWMRGFACLVPVGDFQGGDLLMRELGLRLEAPPGSIQFLRGRELVHSITKWTGKQRFVVVHATGDNVKKWFERTPEEKLAGKAKEMADHKAKLDRNMAKKLVKGVETTKKRKKREGEMGTLDGPSPKRHLQAESVHSQVILDGGEDYRLLKFLSRERQ